MKIPSFLILKCKIKCRNGVDRYTGITVRRKVNYFSVSSL